MMKRLCSVLGAVLVLLMAAACSAPQANAALLELNENIDFGGVLLGMSRESMVELLGEPDAENVSAGGAEFSYHTADISAVVDDGGTVRRMSSKNPEFSLFDIAVGEDITVASERLLACGYEQDAGGSFRYNKDEIQLILLTIDGETVLGFTLEWIK